MLYELLQKNKDLILKKWLNLIIESYPKDAQKFLSGTKDHFNNPVGNTFKEVCEPLYESVLRDDDFSDEETRRTLDRILRIKAVQEFTPAQSLEFVFSLKAVIRETLKKDLKDNDKLYGQLLEVESRIDQLAMASFNVYTDCREQLYKIRVGELKNMTSWILNKFNRKYEDPEETKH